VRLLGPICALLLAVAPASCGDDSDGGGTVSGAAKPPRDAGALLRDLPPNLDYEPVPEAEEERVLRETMPAWVVDKFRDVEMRRVLRDGQLTGVVMALVSSEELNDDDVLTGLSKRAGARPRSVELGGRDARITVVEGVHMIVDVADRQMVLVATVDEAGARFLARRVLLD
jgi:hypothetical protein